MQVNKRGKVEYDVSELYKLAGYVIRRSGIAKMIPSSDVDDLIQDMVLKMYKALAERKYNPNRGTLPTTYLCWVAKNDIARYFRQKATKKRRYFRTMRGFYEMASTRSSRGY
ncbi:MAG: sigma factor [Nitrososphaerales archaeon]